ncbi:MAG: hypothetical protein U5L96_06680 [Owenweeksia sp.]|nr:hypothetical protein [Owenweeksia sp.]
MMSPVKWVALLLELGYGNFPVSELGAFAPDDRVPRSDFFLFGLNSQASRNRLVLKYTLSYALGQNTSNDSLSLSIFAGNFSLGGGYLLVDQEQFKLYPLVAPGFNFTYISISEDRNLSLQEVMEDPGREINMYRLGFMLDFSLNLDFAHLLEIPRGKRGIQRFYDRLKSGLHA